MLAYVWAAGAAVMAAGAPPVRRLRAATETGLPRARADPGVSATSRATDVRLCAACLRAGMSHAAAVSAVAEACLSSDREAWAQSAALLRMGCDARRAWEPLSAVDGLADVAMLAELSSRGGASIAEGLERHADALADAVQAEAIARAERAGVFIAAPLTVCFLPAFIILGLVPIVVDVASHMVTGF